MNSPNGQRDFRNTPSLYRHQPLNRLLAKVSPKFLFGTSTLRHSAVHRVPTSAAGILNMLSAAITFANALNDPKRAGILNMLSAAITFANALNDPKRAEKVAEIKMQLEARIKEIVQNQNLLECKLTGQLKDIAHQRAELDELERSSIEDMLATDKKQRAEVGSALESFFAGSQPGSNPCACGHTPNVDGPEAESETKENIGNSRIGIFPIVLFLYLKSCL